MLEDATGEIMEELSGDDVQSMMDDILGSQSFDFLGYVGEIVNGKVPLDAKNMFDTIMSGIRDNIVFDRKLYVYLIMVAVMGAVVTNFSRLLQGKRVAEMAFYAVYILFFSILSAAFTELTSTATETLNNLFEFMKVLSPSYFMCMSFVTGNTAGSIYYEFTLIMITAVDYVLVKFALPAIQLYFLLEIANQLSEEDMFSKFAELIKDVVNMVMKTMFGVMMGVNVVQGLVVPAAAEVKNSILVKAGSSIPGIGNTISSVASTVLCAGKLVKNAVGVTGIIVVLLICAVPLLKLIISRVLYQATAAVIQPVSDKRIVNCLVAVSNAVKMQMYAVGVGCMMFVISIAIISAMT